MHKLLTEYLQIENFTEEVKSEVEGTWAVECKFFQDYISGSADKTILTFLREVVFGVLGNYLSGAETLNDYGHEILEFFFADESDGLKEYFSGNSSTEASTVANFASDLLSSKQGKEFFGLMTRDLNSDRVQQLRTMSNPAALESAEVESALRAEVWIDQMKKWVEEQLQILNLSEDQKDGCRNAYYKQVLFYTVINNNLSYLIKPLVSLVGVDCKIDEDTDTGDTPLTYATREGRFACVHELLELGANVNAQGDALESAPVLAASWGHLEILNLILDTNQVNQSEKNQSFAMASMNGKIDCMRALWDCCPEDINIEKFNEYITRTALTLAAIEGHEECMDFLLDIGADVNAVDDEIGAPTLKYVIDHNMSKILEKMLEKGAKIDVSTQTLTEGGRRVDCEKPLLDYARELNNDCVKILEEHAQNSASVAASEQEEAVVPVDVDPLTDAVSAMTLGGEDSLNESDSGIA